MTNPVLRQALAYADRGWPVFPCLPGQKIPATEHGFLDATTDQQRITEWFARQGGWNLAIATGAPGPDVLDVDQHGPAGNGFGAFARLRAAGLLEGASGYVRTPSGGVHAYFTGSAQRNGHLPDWHLDFRSAGGYVLAPPSQVSGRTYQRIRTLGGHDGLDWQAVIRLLEPDRQYQQPATRPLPATGSPAWSGGSSPSAKATATPACSGPPTAPWTPTPPPTSTNWPPPPARPACPNTRSPAP
jgi:Bifunctional DNA primase/polymerase, N-terminal